MFYYSSILLFLFYRFSSIYIRFHMTGTTSSLHDKYTATTTPRDGMSRTASGSDINERTYSMFFPIERLAKVRFCEFWTPPKCCVFEAQKAPDQIGFHKKDSAFFPYEIPNIYRFCTRKHSKNAASMALFRRYLWFVYAVCIIFRFLLFIFIHNTPKKNRIHRRRN